MSHESDPHDCSFIHEHDSLRVGVYPLLSLKEFERTSAHSFLIISLGLELNIFTKTTLLE